MTISKYLSVLLSLISCTALANTQPNVILFLVDDMGWADLGVYGSTFHETPNIDQFAAEGIRFTDAYAAGHVCSPTRASLMTGKHPARLKLTDYLPGKRPPDDTEAVIEAEKIPALPLKETTIAEVFKTQGYKTGLFGKWHLGKKGFGPTQQGFDVQVPAWNHCCPGGGYYPPYKMAGLTRENEEDEYVTDRVSKLAVEFIEKSQKEPFFLYLSHFSVHDPIQGRLDLVEKYQQKLTKFDPPKRPEFILEGNPDDPTPLSRKALDALIDTPTHAGHTLLPNRTVKVKQHQDNVHFAAMVESIDHSFARIINTLERLNLRDNTIILFYSDNGGMSAANWWNRTRVVPDEMLDKAYATANLPLRGAKGWLYEGGIRVPLIVQWPGQGARGVTSATPIITADFFPTILEMAGIAALDDQHLDGVSFAADVRGEVSPAKSLFWHFPHYSNHGMQSPAGAIRRGQFKLIEYFENDTIQLFDLSTDIGETTNLAKPREKLAQSLLDELHGWRKRVGAAMPTKRTTAKIAEGSEPAYQSSLKSAALDKSIRH